MIWMPDQVRHDESGIFYESINGETPMGLIAGILEEGGPPARMSSTLHEMMAIQAHRGRGLPEIFVHENVAFGMVNPHNALFCSSDVRPAGSVPCSAVVDGIVLGPSVHGRPVGTCPSSLPLCSSLIEEAYRKWDLDFMRHLDGEFACAIWDDDRRRLVLARDPFGHKPLHYYHGHNRFLFSSEIKGILAAGIRPEIDLVNLSDFLSLNCIPYPGTIFKDIYQVPPGSVLVFEDGDIKISRYRPRQVPETLPLAPNDAVARLDQLIRDVVRKRLLTDEVYCFLSGGIDSSAVLSFAAEASGRPVHAVTVGFEEEEVNELRDAAVMARHVGAEHHPLIVKPDSFFDMLDTMVFHHDSPFTDTSAYPTYFAAQAGRCLTDIILTGDGPDQIMGGSSHYVFAVRNDIFAQRGLFRAKTAGFAARLLGGLISDPGGGFLSRARRRLYREGLSPVHAAYDLRSCFPDIVKRFLCTDYMWRIHTANNPYRHPERWFAEAEGLDDINKYLQADMEFYLPDDLMIKVDRMSMAHGLETLCPFLDMELVGFVERLPGTCKISKLDNGSIRTKHVLVEVCKGRFPEQILNKKKQGFGIPLEKWLRKDNGKALKEILLDPRTLNRPYFKKEAMENLVQVFLDGRGDYFYPSPNAVAGLLTLELWHRRYLD